MSNVTVIDISWNLPYSHIYYSISTAADVPLERFIRIFYILSPVFNIYTRKTVQIHRKDWSAFRVPWYLSSIRGVFDVCQKS